MKAHLKKVLSYILAMVMLLAVFPLPNAIATEPTEPGITLGSASLSGGKFYYDNAWVFGQNIRTILISFSDSVKAGDAIVLPATPAGFTVSASSASNKYTKRINLIPGIAASDVENYIRGVGFTLASPTQTVQITVTTEDITQDTFYNQGTEHYYQFIPDTTSTWIQAYNAAKLKTYMGRTGYLATVTSLGEDTFVNALSNGKTGWLGGTILTNTGISAGTLYYNGFNNDSVVSTGWYWACGPERGTIFYNINTLYPNHNNTTFINQRDSLNATYYNWTRGYDNEPTNNTEGFYLNSNYETCLSTLNVYGRTGKHGTAFSWNDIRYDSAGSDSYTANGYMVEYGDQLTGDSGSAGSTFATDSGMLEAVYAATVNTYIDSVLAAAPGVVELWQGGSAVYTLSSGATGVYTTSAVDGTYDIFINNEDTEQDMVVNGETVSVTVEYATVSYAVADAGTASGSTISAVTLAGEPVASGTVVLCSKGLRITATGAGADSYEYAWTGSGTSGESGPVIFLPNIPDFLNAICTVTGSDTPTLCNAFVLTRINGVPAAAPGSVELWQGGAMVYTLIMPGPAGFYATQVDYGTYDLYINNEDTGKDIIADREMAGVPVDYYTVSFAVANAGTASGSTISATAGGTTFTSGAAVLAGKPVTITAAGAGATTYTYLWSGADTNGETTADITISSLSNTASALCTVTGTTTTQQTYAANIRTWTDWDRVAAPGSVELWQGGAMVYTASIMDTGRYTASAINGTYDIYINNEDTGIDITINDGNATADVDYYTVSFSAADAGTAFGSTISATAGGSPIASGTAVLKGKAVSITATGAGTDNYTYLWSGLGTSGETTASITIPSLNTPINALCTVTGTTAPVTGAAIVYTYQDGAPAAVPGNVELKQGGTTMYTLSSSATGIYTALTTYGTYDIYINNEDTGEDVTVSASSGTVEVYCYTVSFAVANAGTASGSTISATAGGSPIASVTAVLKGKAVSITATGAGTDNYTYLWSGLGTSGETASSLTISSLGGTVNALCTVTGSANVYAPGTLAEEADDFTIVADGLFSQDARLYILPIPEGETNRAALEALQSGKQTAAAFEVYMEPANAFKPPLTLRFGLGERLNGKTVYILHRLHNGDVEHFTVTVANGEAVITVQELSPFLLSLDPPVTITAQLQNAAIVTGQTATFWVTAAGAGPLSYQWQKKTGINASWEDISGAVGAEYTTSQANLGNSGFQYRVIITDVYGRSVTSSAATLTVTQAPISPATGDPSQPILDAVLMMLFTLGLILLLRKRNAA